MKKDGRFSPVNNINHDASANGEKKHVKFITRTTAIKKLILIFYDISFFLDIYSILK